MSTLGVWDRTGDQQVRDSLVGNGRSVASTQLAQGQRAIQNAAYSQAASQRGGNPALAVRNAQHAAAIAGAENNYNQAKLRAQEQLQYQQVAQAEDEKRGKFIGGILGGTGALIGSLGGPVGTVAGGALGAAAGNLIGGNPEGALQAGIGSAVQQGAGAALQGAVGGASPKSSWVAGQDNGLNLAQKASGLTQADIGKSIAPTTATPALHSGLNMSNSLLFPLRENSSSTNPDLVRVPGSYLGGELPAGGAPAAQAQPPSQVADQAAAAVSSGLGPTSSIQSLPSGPAPVYDAGAQPSAGSFQVRNPLSIAQTMPVAPTQATVPASVTAQNAPNGYLPTPNPLSLTVPINTSGYGSLSGNQSFPGYMGNMSYDQWAAERGHAGRMRLGRRLY